MDGSVREEVEDDLEQQLSLEVEVALEAREEKLAEDWRRRLLQEEESVVGEVLRDLWCPW